MVLKFPSGQISVSIQDLQETQKRQSTCGVCNKPWIIKSEGCIQRQLHILHPCLHLVGSGCWTSVPDEHKDKCPVCKVKIRCDEKVRVRSPVENLAPASRESETERTGSDQQAEDIKVQRIFVEQKMNEGLNDVDVRAIMYYMNLRARLDTVKGFLPTLLASTKTLTPTHRKRLILFLANTPATNDDDKQQKVDIALSAFNISGGTYFTMNDLRTILSSAEGWIKKHFAAILEDTEKVVREASAVQQLEERLADVEAELKELKTRQSQETAQRLKAEIKLAVEVIEKIADKEVVKVRAEAAKEVVNVEAKVRDEVVNIGAVAEGEIAKLQVSSTIRQIFLELLTFAMSVALVILLATVYNT